MLSQRTAKSHGVKWAEAERELVIRGVFLPSFPVNREYFSIPQDPDVPQIAEEPDPLEIDP